MRDGLLDVSLKIRPLGLSLYQPSRASPRFSMLDAAAVSRQPRVSQELKKRQPPFVVPVVGEYDWEALARAVRVVQWGKSIVLTMSMGDLPHV